jgi:hypothetical protein
VSIPQDTPQAIVDHLRAPGNRVGEEKGSARGSVHWSGYDAKALDIEVDPQRCRFGSRKSDFALQALVEYRALEPK